MFGFKFVLYLRQIYKTFRHLQEKRQNISPLKQRILSFIEEIGISKREFYAKTGISRGTLESETGMTEETMTKFLATYNNIDPSWLITGAGEMYRIKKALEGSPIKANFNIVEEPAEEYNAQTPEENLLLKYLREKDHVIQGLCERIGHLEEQIKSLKNTE